jgi:hypothetical protein
MRNDPLSVSREPGSKADFAPCEPSPSGRLLVVDFRQPRTLVMLWFEFHFGTNPPLGTNDITSSPLDVHFGV